MLTDIARIRQQIETECTAMVHASLFASVARHDIIEKRYNTLDKLTQELTTHMPKEEAIQTMIETYDSALEDAKTQKFVQRYD